MELSPKVKKPLSKRKPPVGKEEIVRSRIAKLLKVEVGDLEEKLEEIAAAVEKKWITAVDLKRRFKLSQYGLDLIKEYLHSGVLHM